MSPNFQRLSILSGFFAILAGCDPNVLIGAKWSTQEAGGADSVGGGGMTSVGGGGGGAGAGAGTPAGGDAAGGSGAGGEGGSPSAGAGGAPDEPPEWCATAPIVNEPVLFDDEGSTVIPAGSYLITYVSGAQIHDVDIGYEVTDWYYGKNMLQAGHHVFDGATPGAGSTDVWLDEEGIVGSGGSIAEIEAANRGHTWPLEHAGGELRITLLDDDYHDNSGPGSRFCITKAAPP